MEKYGGSILNSWFDRPLSVAGRLIVNENGKLEILLSTDDGSEVEVAKEITNLPTSSGYLYEVEEDIRIDHKTIMVRGWIIENPLVTEDKNFMHIEDNKSRDAIGFPLTVYDHAGNIVDITRIGERRDDIVNAFGLTDTVFPYGFLISWDYKENEIYRLQLGEDDNCHETTLDIAKIQAEKRERERHFANFKL